MKEQFLTESRARLRTLLTLGYTLLIVYASLSPFSGWTEQGLVFSEVLHMQLTLTYTTFDAVLNLLSYLPFGLLLGLTLRARLGNGFSLLFGLILGTTLSSGMEYLQMFLPSRTSSNVDILTNTGGTLIGLLLALSITSWTGLYDNMMRWRSELFHHGREMDFGLALLALWVFGQLNPSLPLLGNVFIGELARQPFAITPPAPFNIWSSGAVMLNLLMLGALLISLVRGSRNVISLLLAALCLVAATKFIIAIILLKSWAVLLWISSEAVLGILAGMIILLILLWLPRPAALIGGSIAALSHMLINNLLLEDTILDASSRLYHWHYGHLLTYNGLAQTIAMTFPLLLIFHLWRIRKF
jgi:VanZ family protein